MKNAQVVDTRDKAVVRGSVPERLLAERVGNPAGKGVRRMSPVSDMPANRRMRGDSRFARARPERAWKTADVSRRASMVGNLATRLAAVLVAAVISFGLLGSVAWFFQRDGMPLQRVAAAERACADRAYVSERDACMRTAVRAGAPTSRVQACAASPHDSPRMEC